MRARVIKSTGSWYRLKNNEGSEFDARLRGKFKLVDKKITNPIAVGDWVEVEETVEGDYAIHSILDRENYVIRVSPRKKGHYHMLASNIDQAVLITSLRQPRTSIGFIDRFLITLETFRIHGIIVINKTDLYSDAEIEALMHTKTLYEGIGYDVIFTSFEQEGADQLFPLLKGKTSLLAGHSGTGKSTLINVLFPDASQDIKEISSFADKGVHTTTFAEMFTMKDGTEVIDTPGIKELGLADIEPEELSHYFPEMRAYLGQCRFNNCIHINEPNCAIQEALNEGKISLSRFESYVSMLEGDDNRR